jgi:hypothetical protein
MAPLRTGTSNKKKWIFGAVLALLSALAARLAVNQPPSITDEQACKAKCHPLPWALKGERRIPNAPEGWRNYETRAKCVCG